MEKLGCCIFLLLFFAHTSSAQQLPAPANYIPLKEVSGDLDKDGITEKVVVYDMADSVNSEGVAREIIIYKKEKKGWVIWQRSMQAVRRSKQAFLGVDPFSDVEINRGVLLISHESGARWKELNIDKYRFQDGVFSLIGFTVSYGALCEYWLNIDYNLSTGKINITKEYESCENKQTIVKRENEVFIHPLKEKITLKNRLLTDIEITSPKYKHQFTL